jgi:hypothetical protein
MAWAVDVRVVALGSLIFYVSRRNGNTAALGFWSLVELIY